MKYSENYSLNKPDWEDQYNIEHWNENTDKIDARMRKNQDEIESNDRDIATLFEESSKTNSSVAAINAKIPSAASAANQLADKDFVNSSIATNTANFVGTFKSLNELNTNGTTKTNNDYAFVQTTDSSGNTIFQRYKWNGTTWLYEYELNNSSFTSDQWSAINSGATASNIKLIKTMSGANANADGSSGFVPQPKKGDQNKALCGDGTWKDVTSMSGAVTLQAAFNAAHPVGGTYVQYPQQDDPNTLFNKNGVTSTWSVVNYDGAFFRAQGGNAETFIDKSGILSKQKESVPNIKGRAYLMIHSSYDKTQNGALYTEHDGSSDGNESSKRGTRGFMDLDASKSNAAYGTRNEVAPANYTIRVWKRTA